jgi:hypothetical protein
MVEEVEHRCEQVLARVGIGSPASPCGPYIDQDDRIYSQYEQALS